MFNTTPATINKIEEKIIKWCKEEKYNQGDSYYVFISKNGKWCVEIGRAHV